MIKLSKKFNFLCNILQANRQKKIDNIATQLISSSFKYSSVNFSLSKFFKHGQIRMKPVGHVLSQRSSNSEFDHYLFGRELVILFIVSMKEINNGIILILSVTRDRKVCASAFLVQQFKLLRYQSINMKKRVVFFNNFARSRIARGYREDSA